MTPQNARVEMILSHMPQVKFLARRMHQRCPQVELDDLVSVATIGLIQAVDRFDPSRGLKLKTLAEHRIRGAMLDYLRKLDPLPRNVRRFQKERDAVLARLNSAGDTPDLQEVARLLGVPARKFDQWSRMIAASETLSLDSVRV